MGGATAKIGDPSGRKTERDALQTNTIDDNIAGLYKNIETIFNNHEKFLWKSQEPLQPVK